jgi:penicillin amidase
MARSSVAATIYAFWEDQLIATLIADKIKGPLAAEFVARGGDWLVPALTHPNVSWFGQAGAHGRDLALIKALTAAVADLKMKLGPDMDGWKWEQLHTATFRHPLGVNASLASRLNIGPIPRDGYALTPFSTGGPSYTQTIGATFREIIDLSDWDKSVATSAPGQSGQPGSPHFADLAKLWGEGQYFPLPFTETAVRAAAEATLTLTPSK